MNKKAICFLNFVFILLFYVNLSFTSDLSQKLQQKVIDFQKMNQRNDLVNNKSYHFDGIIMHQNQNKILTTIRETNDLFLWALLPQYYYDYEIDSLGSELGINIDYRPIDDVFSILGAFYGVWVDRPISSLDTYKNRFESAAKQIAGTNYKEIINERSTRHGIPSWNFCYESAGSVIWNSQLFLKDEIAYNLYYITTKSNYESPLQKLYFNLVLELFILDPPKTSVNFNKVTNTETFSLMQNYPNPFNNDTTIRFKVTNNSNVILDIYNINGQHVKNIVNKYYLPGTHNIKINLQNLNSGIYFYRMQNADKILSKKMTYLK